MKSKNYVSLIGIAGKDAEYRQTQQGVKYARFTVATSEGGYTKKDGTAVPEMTQWHQVICWDKMAEYAAKFIKKGIKVAIEGKIMYGEYQDANGAKKMSCDIVASDFCLMQKPQMQNGVPSQPTPAQQQAQGYGGYQQNAGRQPFPPQGPQPQQPHQNVGLPNADDGPF